MTKMIPLAKKKKGLCYSLRASKKIYFLFKKVTEI